MTRSQLILAKIGVSPDGEVDLLIINGKVNTKLRYEPLRHIPVCRHVPVSPVKSRKVPVSQSSL